MNNSLKHLPQRKRDELAKIISTICDNCKDVERGIIKKMGCFFTSRAFTNLFPQKYLIKKL